MTKLRKGLSALLLSAFMTLGVGIGTGTKNVVEGRAIESTVLTFPDENKNNNKQQNYSNSWNAKIGSNTWEINNFNNNKWDNKWTYIKCGSKNGASVGSITNTTAIDKIDTIVVTVDKVTTDKVNEFYVTYGKTSSTINENKVASTIKQGENTFSLNTTEYSYFSIFIDCSKGTSNGIVQISKVEYKNTLPVTATKIQSVELSDSSKAFYCGETINKSDFVVKADNGDIITDYTIAPETVPTTEGAFDVTFTSETLGSYVFNATAAKKLTNVSLKEGTNVKTTYFDGESFDPNNLVINAFYNSEETPTEITYAGNESRFTFEPSGSLKTTDTNVKVIYSDGYTALSFDLPVTVRENRIESLTIEGDMTKKTYSIDSNWDVAGLIVKGTYTSGEVSDVTNNVTWIFDPATANSLDITSVNVKASLDGIESSIKNIANIVVNSTKEELYDFSKITGFEDWDTTYLKREITNVDVGATIGAKITFDKANKQSGTITDVPVMKDSTVRFELTESNYIISSIQITLKQWSNKNISINLFSDTDTTKTPILTRHTAFTINYENLNSASFAFTNTISSQVGIAAIKVILTSQTQLEFGTLDHIKVTTLPAKTEYVLNEAFDSSGLVVTAYDGADEETANKLLINSSDENLTIAYNDGEKIQETGELAIDIEYTKDGISKETSFTIFVYGNKRYEKVIAPLSDWSGSYIIMDSNDQLLLNSSLETLDSKDNTIQVQPNSNVIETSSIYEFTITKKDTNYSIKSQKGYYIGSSGSGSLSTSTTDDYANTIEFSNNSIVVKCSNASLSYKTDALRFRYYTNGSIQLYRFIDESAEIFAQFLLNDVVCDPTGVTPPSTSEWETIKSSWLDLTEEQKLFVKESGADENGSDIQKAVWKYDYIISKYGSERYEDFMSRNPIRAITSPNILNQNGEATIAIIVIISLVSVSSIGGYLFIRKRKEQ